MREDSLIVVQASGSGYHNTSATMIGAYVKHDGVIVGDIQVFANTNAVHMAFVSDSMVLNGVSAGSHTLSLEAISPTITDGNDIFKVSVLELPTGTALA